MEDAEGVPTEGSMGLAVFEWWSLLGFVALSPLLRFRWLGVVNVIEVPHQWWEVPIEDWGVKGVVAAGLVRRESQDGRCLFP